MILTPEETKPIFRRHTNSFLLYFLMGRKMLPMPTCVDIGAFHTQAGHGFGFPSPLYWLPGASLHAFEGHPESFRKLQTGLHRYPSELLTHEAILSDKSGSGEFHETINPLYSSLCRPLLAPTQDFCSLEGLKWHRALLVTTHTLDQLRIEKEIPPPSAISLDVNGHELAVLRGARRSLQTCILVTARLGQYPLFQQQSSLGATENFLAESGLQFHHSRHPHRHRLSETELYHTTQILNTEALFFPSSDRFRHLSADQLLTLAVLASLYEVLDLAEKALLEYDRKQNTHLLTEFRDAFLERFNPAALHKYHPNPLVIPGTPKTIFVPIQNEVEVAVPDTLDLLTPYLLREQGDWMESELPWLRNIVQPGMKVLDIGANYGVYSLALAKVVGPTGKIWSIEPTPQLYAYLVESRSRNQFDQMEIFPLALTLSQGEAAFFVSKHSEYNSLTPSGVESNCIRVNTDTLDHFAQARGITGVDLLKIDAEGEEVNILESGQRFLMENNPIILAEVRHGKTTHFEVIDKLESLGFGVHRLIPGLGILTPFDRHGEVEKRNMNVLACKPSRAQELQSAGLLSSSHETYDEVKFTESAFELYLSCLPYGPVFATRIPPDWLERFEGGTIYRDCLHAFSVSLLKSISPDKRVGLLEFAFHQLHDLVEKEATLPRLLSLSRIAIAWGHSQIAQNILTRLSSEILGGVDFRLMEPFLCPSADFDLIDPQPNPGLWCIASILHEKIKVSSLSSYFESSPPIAELQKLESLGYLLPPMQRRLNLIRSRVNR